MSKPVRTTHRFYGQTDWPRETVEIPAGVTIQLQDAEEDGDRLCVYEGREIWISKTILDTLITPPSPSAA